MNCRAALCQLRPVLGDAAKNLESHLAWLDQAAQAEAQLVVFPELSLHGYFLRDLTQEVALTLDAAPVQELVQRSKDRSILFGMVEESRDHQFYNSMVFAEDGEILHVHRKLHLPDYGIFEEGRYFAAGDNAEVVQSKHGKFGILICEDAWHLSTGWLHFMQGADCLLLPSASPARGIDTAESDLSSQAAWDTLIESHALFFQTWVVHCNRVGFEDGTSFWGGSSVASPFGDRVAQAGQEEEMLVVELNGDRTRRARMMTPLRRDARPDWVRKQLARILADPDALRPEAAAEQSEA